jgi:hypothetical protein
MIELLLAAKQLARFSRTYKGQGSLEYIMMLSAVGIIIVVALAMVMQLKGTAMHAFFGDSSNQSIANQLSTEMSNLSNSK